MKDNFLNMIVLSGLELFGRCSSAVYCLVKSIVSMPTSNSHKNVICNDIRFLYP